jgi:hypothetical protein
VADSLRDVRTNEPHRVAVAAGQRHVHSVLRSTVPTGWRFRLPARSLDASRREPFGPVRGLRSIAAKGGGRNPEFIGEISDFDRAGNQGVWRADGKEIFYVAADGKMMAVPIEAGTDFFRWGLAKALFQTRLGFDQNTAAYDVSADGQRFLINEPAIDVVEPPITVIVNWPKLLQK